VRRDHVGRQRVQRSRPGLLGLSFGLFRRRFDIGKSRQTSSDFASSANAAAIRASRSIARTAALGLSSEH
jgi:hypothetical protein